MIPRGDLSAVGVFIKAAMAGAEPLWRADAFARGVLTRHGAGGGF